jgi:hypothetical protein
MEVLHHKQHSTNYNCLETLQKTVFKAQSAAQTDSQIDGEEKDIEISACL